MGKPIGIIELINQIKHELLLEDSKRDDLPDLFLIEKVEVDISVGVTRGGEGKLSLHVIEAGGHLESERVQNVHITLIPLVDIESQRKVILSKMGRAEKVQAARVIFKSGEIESLDQLP